MGQDQADVVACTAKDGVEGIAQGTFERASGEATVGFHIADGGFYGGSAAEFSSQGGRHGAALTGDVDDRPLGIMATVTPIDEGAAGAGVGKDFDLFEGFVESLAVIGIAHSGAHADDEAFFVGGCNRDFTAKLIALVGLAL